MERAERAKRTRRREPIEVGEATETLAMIAADGNATSSPALFSTVSDLLRPKAARTAWERDVVLWPTVALALLLRYWHVVITPASVGVALASVVGVALAYIWMRRSFGGSVAMAGALLLAADGFAVATGRSATLVGLVPTLLALWLLLLATGSAQGSARWLLLATLPLALAAAIVPIAGILTPVLPTALVLLPAQTDATDEGSTLSRRTWSLGTALVALPLAGVVLGLGVRVRSGNTPTLILTTPQSLEILLGVVVVLGWLALGMLLITPVRALWRWYALASDPHERRMAVWSRLREDARWRLRALLWLAALLPALVLPFAPRAISTLPLLPTALALPGMVGEELHARLPRMPAIMLWRAMLALLALALAMAALWR